MDFPSGSTEEVEVTDEIGLTDSVQVELTHTCDVRYYWDEWPYLKHCGDDADYQRTKMTYAMVESNSFHKSMDGVVFVCEWHFKCLMTAWPEQRDSFDKLSDD